MSTASKFSALTAQQKADMRDAIRGYKVYCAMLSQPSNDVLIASTVFENTLGFTLNAYGGSGSYYQSTGLENLVMDKTFIFITHNNIGSDLLSSRGALDNSEGLTLIIQCFSHSVGSLAQVVTSASLNNAFLEIRVYP